MSKINRPSKFKTGDEVYAIEGGKVILLGKYAKLNDQLVNRSDEVAVNTEFGVHNTRKSVYMSRAVANAAIRASKKSKGK